MNFPAFPPSLLLAFTFTCALAAASPAAPSPVLPAWDETDSWSFTPATDEFSPAALVDLRSLNETIAGEHGRVRLSPDGNDFVRGDGAPLRFWAVNTEVQKQALPAVQHHLRFLAKRGVNLVRWHGFLNPRAPKNPATPLPPLEEPNQHEIEDCWKLVAAARTAGVYVVISPYWGMNFRDTTRWGYSPNEGSGPFAGDNGKGLLFFDARLQAAYKNWLRALFIPANPHTGLPLAQDPAVAILQIQNEDSLLHPSLDRLHPRHRAELAAQISTWLIQRHGSLAAARATWGDDPALPEDNLSAGTLGLLPLATYSAPPAAGQPSPRRLAAQLEFLASLMHAFNAEIARFVREDLHCDVLINASNWRTADATRLYDAERWAYTANEVIANNRYYHPVHLGPQRHWAMEAGDQFANDSVLHFPRNLPLTQRQVEGHPFIITESTWVFPNRLRAEGPLLVAAYSGLTGIDAYCWFNLYSADWHQPRELASGTRLGADMKWGAGAPDLLGQFPAAALLHRRADVTAAAPIVEETRPLSDLWQYQPAALSEDIGFDPTRDLGDSAPLSTTGGVPQLAMLTGPVRVRYTREGAAALRVGPFSSLIDSSAQRIRSATGQHELDWGRGLFSLDTPRAQGFTGLLGPASHGKNTLTTSALTLRNAPGYGALIAVSLDGQPLTTASRILVQLSTQARPTGWQTTPTEFQTQPGGLDAPAAVKMTGEKITALGRAPWRIGHFSGSLQLANPALTTATVCDANFLPLRRIPVTPESNGVSLILPADALYVVLSAD
jgi:hypothetical protein